MLVYCFHDGALQYMQSVPQRKYLKKRSSDAGLVNDVSGSPGSYWCVIRYVLHVAAAISLS